MQLPATAGVLMVTNEGSRQVEPVGFLRHRGAVAATNYRRPRSLAQAPGGALFKTRMGPTTVACISDGPMRPLPLAFRARILEGEGLDVKWSESRGRTQRAVQLVSGSKMDFMSLHLARRGLWPRVPRAWPMKAGLSTHAMPISPKSGAEVLRHHQGGGGGGRGHRRNSKARP